MACYEDPEGNEPVLNVKNRSAQDPNPAIPTPVVPLGVAEEKEGEKPKPPCAGVARDPMGWDRNKRS